jgi:hypothetical protein
MPRRPKRLLIHAASGDNVGGVQATDPTAYYVSSAAGSVYLIVRQHNGNDYLTTEADGSAQNNLLSLPEC